MSKKNKPETIDKTQLEGETHHSEMGDEQAVAGSNGTDDGRETIENWPSNLPKELFSDDAKNGIKLLVLGHSKDGVADQLDYSDSWVRNLTQKAALFLEPDRHQWLNDNDPTWDLSRMPKRMLNHPDVRQEVLEDAPDSSNESAGASGDKTTEEATDATASTSGDDSTAADGAGEIDAEVLGQQPDLAECECAVPELAVDSSTLGPSNLQSLYCQNCTHEFAVIREKSQ